MDLDWLHLNRNYKNEKAFQIKLKGLLFKRIMWENLRVEWLLCPSADMLLK